MHKHHSFTLSYKKIQKQHILTFYMNTSRSSKSECFSMFPSSCFVNSKTCNITSFLLWVQQTLEWKDWLQIESSSSTPTHEQTNIQTHQPVKTRYLTIYGWLEASALSMNATSLMVTSTDDSKVSSWYAEWIHSILKIYTYQNNNTYSQDSSRKYSEL